MRAFRNRVLYPDSLRSSYALSALRPVIQYAMIDLLVLRDISEPVFDLARLPQQADEKQLIARLARQAQRQVQVRRGIGIDRQNRAKTTPLQVAE